MVAGTMAPAARGLRAGLKEAAGKLVAQLYDRNSRRQFVPLEAFQTDSLPPERFRVEMQTAAAASGGLMQANNTRVWGLLRWVTSLHDGLACWPLVSCTWLLLQTLAVHKASAFTAVKCSVLGLPLGLEAPVMTVIFLFLVICVGCCKACHKL